MKKMIFCVVPLVLVLAGCGTMDTTGAPAGGGSRRIVQDGPAEAAGSSGGMDLDQAIKEAAGRMEARIPGGTMVALVSVASSSAQFSEYVISRLEAALVDGNRLVVVDRANLDKVRTEQGFQLSGEVDDDSAKNIGKLLGAGAIVTGSFTNIGDMYSLSLKAINMETATVAVSYPADIAASVRIEALLASGGGAAGSGGRTAQAGGSAAPAKTYQIGDTGPAGGIVFFDKFSNAGGWRYLEAAPKETEQKFPWGDPWTIGTTQVIIGAGKNNTDLIVPHMQGKGIFVTAAQYCSDLEYGGYDDWFLPSKDELNMMYTNLKLKNLGDFSGNWYWSSSEVHPPASLANVHVQNFGNGALAGYDKGETCLLRPIRQF